MRTVYKNDERFRRTYWEHIAPKDGKHCGFIAQVGASGPVLGAVEIK